MGKDSYRFEYDPLMAMQNAPKLMGLEFKQNGRKGLMGGYYLDGAPHAYRKDKMKVFISRGGVWVSEEGGRCISLPQWLIEFGGAADFKDALRMIRGESQAMKWNREVRERVVGDVRYVSKDVLDGARQYDLRLSPLFSFLYRLFPERNVAEVFRKYNVTANAKHQTVFWYMDAAGRICHDKRIYYKDDGHRNKELPMGREYRVADGYSGRPLFGAHLIGDEGDICCLESEKSVLVCALEYPEKCWVATGGKSNLQDVTDRFVLYPDLDAVEEWGNRGKVEEWWRGWSGAAGNADFADRIIEKRLKNKVI